MIRFVSVFVLCVQLFSVSAVCLGRRRQLQEYQAVVEDLPDACTSSEYVCEEQDPHFEVPEKMTVEDAEDMVAYFCCALRKDSRKQLLKIASFFNAACKTDAFRNMEKVEDKTPAQESLLAYCDDLVTSYYKNSYRSSLWEIVRLDDHVQLHSCKNSVEPDAENEVTVHIIGFSYNDGITHAFIELEKDEVYSWGPSVEHYGLESAKHLVENRFGSELMDGVKGEMFVTSMNKISVKNSYKISGVNKQAMRKRLKEIKESPPLYSLINFNCAHAVLDVLAEGLGCESVLLPFFSPIALAEIIENSVQTGEIYGRRRLLTNTLSDTVQRVSRLLKMGFLG